MGVTERIDAQGAFRSYVRSIKDVIDNVSKKKLKPADKKKIEDALKKADKWLEKGIQADADETNKQKEELEGVWGPIVKKWYGKSGKGGAQSGEDGEEGDSEEGEEDEEESSFFDGEDES